jgi:uncharacterized protein YfeS
MANEQLLMDLIAANTAALEKVAAAVEANAVKNDKLGKQMDRMVDTIAKAQRKIGGEIGPIIKQSKDAVRRLHEEAEAAVRARKGNGGTA